jgi:hypothetical protein
MHRYTVEDGGSVEFGSDKACSPRKSPIAGPLSAKCSWAGFRAPSCVPGSPLSAPDEMLGSGRRQAQRSNVYGTCGPSAAPDTTASAFSQDASSGFAMLEIERTSTVRESSPSRTALEIWMLGGMMSWTVSAALLPLVRVQTSIPHSSGSHRHVRRGTGCRLLLRP